jgi:putative phosphoribosyl transferase
VKSNSNHEERAVKITSEEVTLDGNLSVPKGARGIVIFVHGSGSSRHSPRNQLVASILQEAGLATFLFDLLTAEEDVEDARYGQYRFDIEMLANRLTMVTDWLVMQRAVKKLIPGYFGASTGAAAALVSAAERAEIIGAVVSRGGRPDLATGALPRVKAPTLLIVGGNDFAVINVNRTALVKLEVEKELAIVPGASHLFEEPGALKNVARLAVDWFKRYLEKSDVQT